MSALAVAAGGVAGLVAKATLVLCLALALAWLGRRGSARTLHLLWTTTFVVLLALPVVNLLGPSWPLPILPARDAQAGMLSLEKAEKLASAAGIQREMPGAPISAGSMRARPMNVSGSSPVESGLSQFGASDLPSPLTLSAIAFLIWAVGCAAALASLVVGGLRFRKLVRTAVPMSKPGWLQQAASIRRRLSMRKNVRILITNTRATTPMTGGLWRPVVLLPSSAENWTPDRRQVVLAHELVHVRRCDALRHLLGRVAAACYWFHPLGWLASRLSAVASERSCDEEVLALGTRPSEYARHLFSLASETVGRSAALALGMVQRSQLEDRIRSILRQHRPRYSAVGTTSALVAIGMVGTLLACGNPVPREPAPQASTPENAETERLAAAPPMSEPIELAPPVTDAPPVESPSVEPAPAPLATPEPVTPQPFQCNPGKWTVVRRRGEWTLQRHVDGLRMCMRNRGNFDIWSQNVAAESTDEGSWLVLESQAERLHRLVVTPGPEGLEYDWSIDGRSEVFDDRAREWRDLMLTVMNGDLEVQDVLAEESSLQEIGWAHRRHVSGLQRQIGAHQRHVGGLQRQIGAHQRHISDLHRQLARTDDLAQRVREIEEQIEEYDLDGKIRELEIQIEDYDLDGRIRGIEMQIEEYDLDGKIEEAEARVEEFDADGRIDEIERALEDEIAGLRRIVG